MEFHTTTAIGIQVKALADFLMTASVGETVLFSDMNKELGIDVTRRRYIIEKARELLLAEHGIRFDSVYREGLKRMNIDDAVGVSDRAVGKIRRTARVASQRIVQQVGKANNIPESTLAALNARRSLLGAIEALASKRSIKAVEAVADDRVIPFGRVLEAVR